MAATFLQMTATLLRMAATFLQMTVTLPKDHSLSSTDDCYSGEDYWSVAKGMTTMFPRNGCCIEDYFACVADRCIAKDDCHVAYRHSRKL